MNTYTLHIALLGEDRLTALEELKASLGDVDLFYEPVEARVDGDSYLQWGEAFAPDEAEDAGWAPDALHGQIEFRAHTHEDAYAIGTAIFRDLLLWPDSPVGLGYAADPHGTIATPFAVSLADVWGAQIGPGGRRNGDPHPSDHRPLKVPFGKAWAAYH